MATREPAVVLLSFEGPDSYALAGGLGARVSSLGTALAGEGYDTHLFFVGSPESQGHEVDCDGKLHLHRWCQWISRYHAGGVYDGEEGKLYDWSRSVPAWLADHLLPDLLRSHDSVVVIGEEWHTSWSIVSTALRARERGWDKRVRFFWNANNTFGFDRVPWRDLSEHATITTVSRFMKHEMWRSGVDAHVIPNGIAPEWLEPCDPSVVRALKHFIGARLLLTKVARWHPDKRWLAAFDTIAELKKRGLRPLFVARGGVEEHGCEALAHARTLGLKISEVQCVDSSAAGLYRAIAGTPACDVVIIRNSLSRVQLQCLYRTSNGVLANSGIEPFGLVGLEAMASGGVSFVGATGEDYANAGHNAISLQTSRPNEVVNHLLFLREHPAAAKRLRQEARKTAARFTWDKIIRTHISPILSLPAPEWP